MATQRPDEQRISGCWICALESITVGRVVTDSSRVRTANKTTVSFLPLEEVA